MNSKNIKLKIVKLIKVFGVLMVILISNKIGYAQNNQILARWLKIKPLINNRIDAEKIYGKGEVSKNKYFVLYRVPDGVVLIGYSSDVCGSKYSIWDIPEWTVTDVTYNFFKNSPDLRSLIGRSKQFKKGQYSDVLNHVEYYDKKLGIKILYDTEEKRVRKIIIIPSAQDDLKFRCKEN